LIASSTVHLLLSWQFLCAVPGSIVSRVPIRPFSTELPERDSGWVLPFGRNLSDGFADDGCRKEIRVSGLP